MKVTKQTRREVKQLFRLCLVDGLLDENRARQVVQQIVAAKPRHYLATVSYFRRLVQSDCARHTARVETALSLPADLQASLKTSLARAYGPGLKTSFAENSALIGGMRIRVGSDVYDGSVQGRLAALEQQPFGYLQGVTETSFPRGTRLLGQVRIAGSGAIVNLGGAIARASPSVLANAAAQLVWTLTSPSYGRSAIRSVRLEINGQDRPLPRSPGGTELLGTYQSMVPIPPARTGLYFIGSKGAVQVLSASQVTARPAAAHGQAGTGLVPMATIAVSPPDERFIAGISPDGEVVHYGPLEGDATLGSWRPGGRIRTGCAAPR
jgi:F-type H+-transporting ATPase subunit delta